MNPTLLLKLLGGGLTPEHLQSIEALIRAVIRDEMRAVLADHDQQTAPPSKEKRNEHTGSLAQHG